MSQISAFTLPEKFDLLMKIQAQREEEQILGSGRTKREIAKDMGFDFSTITIYTRQINKALKEYDPDTYQWLKKPYMKLFEIYKEDPGKYEKIKEEACEKMDMRKLKRKNLYPKEKETVELPEEKFSEGLQNNLLNDMISNLNQKTEIPEETEIKTKIEQEETEEPEDKKINWILIFGIGSIVISGLVIFFLSKKTKEEKEEPTVSTATGPVENFQIPPIF